MERGYRVQGVVAALPFPTLVATACVAALAGCGSAVAPQGTVCDESAFALEYPAGEFAANTVVERSVMASFSSVVTSLKSAATGTTEAPTAGDLLAAYRHGSPSAADWTLASFRATVEDLLGAFGRAATSTWQPQPSAGESVGGRYASFVFSPGGLDLQEAFEKTQYAALHYHQAWQRTHSGAELTASAVDQAVALYGTTPAFPNTHQGVPAPDTYSAKYTARRSRKDAQDTLYQQMKVAFARARSAATQGEACGDSARAAVAELFTHWEQAMMATAVYYLNDATKKFSAASTNAEQAAALHAYGEAVSLVIGFGALPQAERRATDVEIAQVLTLLEAGAGATVRADRFVSEGASKVAQLQTATDYLARIYQWTPAQLAEFRVAY